MVGLVGTTQDVTEHREAEHRLREREQHLEQLALRDVVTGLANRAAFTDELHRVLETARRWNSTVGLVMLDLDGFKEVNDSLGHPAGDEVLRQVALRITRAVRAGDFVARMGGDEFMVLTGEVSDPSESARVARRLVDVMRAPFDVEGTEVTQTVSAGIALAQPGAEPEELLREADAALYVAKSHGRDRSEFFDDRLRARTSARLALEDGLRHAIARGELSVDYQPEVDLVDGSVVAVEALLRWQRGDDRVEAGEFIAVAEDTGLITELGAWAIREACVHASRWKMEAPDGRLLTVRVNVSPLQLRDPQLPKIVSSALADSGLTPSRLCLELTETAGLQDTETVRENLRLLSKEGVKFAVDDFGTGEASLFALTRVPVDVLKLDRDFVLALSDEGHSDVVAGVVAFATRLGVDVGAEGVEHGDQATLLRKLGCRTGQGFLWSAAMPPDEIDGILGGPNPAWVKLGVCAAPPSKRRRRSLRSRPERSAPSTQTIGELRRARDHIETTPVLQPTAVRELDRFVFVVAVERDDNGPRRERFHAQPGRVDRTELGPGDDDHEIGLERRDQINGVAVGRDRRARPTGAFDDADAHAVGPAKLLDERGDRERWAPEGLGGHRRGHRHLVVAVPEADGVGVFSRCRGKDVRVARVLVGLERLHRLSCGDSDPATAQQPERDRREPRLADAGAGTGDDDEPSGSRTHVGATRSSARANASIWSSVCAADSATRRREVPGGTVGGRMAGTSMPSSSSDAAASSVACSSPITTGTIGDGCPGRSRSTCARRRSCSARPSSERSTVEAASAAAVSAGVDAVVKM